MDPAAIALALAGLFLAGIIKGGTGLGFTSCALPFLVPAVGLPVAMTLVIAPALATNAGVALGAGHFRDTARGFWIFYVATLPGIAIGLSLLLSIDRAIAVRALGACVIAYAILAVVKPDLRLAPGLAHKLQAPLGLTNGIIAGLTGSQVVPLLPYMMSLGLEPARLVQAINLSVLLSSIGLALALAWTGMGSEFMFKMSMLAIAPAILGVQLGSRWRARMSAERFRKVVLGVLFIIGVSLIAR
jgi:uncharacterized protein